MNDENRPRLTLELDEVDRLLIAAGFAVMFLMWVFLIWGFDDLPPKIAIRFNAAGEASAWGRKSGILPLAIFSTLQFAGLELLTRFPHTFNYSVSITPENAPKLYRLSVRMLRWINLLIALLFASIVWLMMRSAGGRLDPSAGGLIASGVLLIFVPIVWYLIRARAVIKAKPGS